MENRQVSFRTLLIISSLVPVLIVAAATLYVEVQRPWDALEQLISKSKIVLSGMDTQMDKHEIEKMITFANMAAIASEGKNKDYLAWTFNLYITGGWLLPEKEMREILTKEYGIKDFDYELAKQTFMFWNRLFANSYGMAELFKKYKQMMIETNQALDEAGLRHDDVYMMTDPGKNFLYYLVDGSDWYESTYAGQLYDLVEEDDLDYIDYREKGLGFYYNPLHYYLGIFPMFDVYEGESWYTVWYWQKAGKSSYNINIDFLASNVKAMMWKIGAIVIASAVVIFVLIFLISNFLIKKLMVPVNNMIIATTAVQKGHYDHRVAQSTIAEFSELIEFFNQAIEYIKRRLNLLQALKIFTSKKQAEMIDEHGWKPMSEKLKLTILFTDFKDFTKMSQKLEPEEFSDLTNIYFELLGNIAKKYDGLINKYIGDAMLIVFGYEEPIEGHAERAVNCAIEMQLKLKEFNEQRIKDGLEVFWMRVGINTDITVMGTFGFEDKVEVTPVGESVNLANRMEGACKEIGVDILMTEGTFKEVSKIEFDNINVDRSPREVTAKGYEGKIKAYAIVI